MTTQPTYTHPKIAARIRAYLRRDTDHTPTGILRGVHKQASRIHTTLRELEANGEIYRHLSPQPGPPDTWHLTDTTHDTNPGTNTTTPTETQPEQPLEGWLTEVNTGDIHPREAARLLDELFTRVATQPGWPGVSATLKLLGDLHRDLLAAAKGADRDYPEEAEQIDPGVVVDQLAESIGYRREGDRLVPLTSDEIGGLDDPPCVCGHPKSLHSPDRAQDFGCNVDTCYADGRCSGYVRDLTKPEHVGQLSEEALLDVGMRARLHEGWGQYAEQTPVADRLVVTPPWGHWVHDRVTIDAEHGVRVEGKDGEVFHMPAEGGMHRDVAGKPCKADPLVVALGSYLNDATAALDVVAWLADQDLLANPPERA